MKLKDMLATTSDDQLREAFVLAYPRLTSVDIEDHVEVARQLRAMEPEPPEADDGDPVTTIVVARKPVEQFEGKGAEFRFDVSGRSATATSWAIEFMPWQQWLGLEVVVEPAGIAFRAPELLAHCLYEMTFCGFSQGDIQAKRDEIIALKNEVVANNDHEADGA